MRREVQMAVVASIILLAAAGMAIAQEPAAPAPDAPQPNAPTKVQEAENEKPAPKERTLAWVLSDLRNEASQAIFKDGFWTRTAADYAEDRNVSTDVDEIPRVLARRLHQNPAIDGYVRWQLLSFKPDLSATMADAQAMRRLVATMPRVMDQPEPVIKPVQTGGLSVMFTGMQRAFLSDKVPVPGARGARPTLSVVSAGTGLSAGGSVSSDGRYVAATAAAAGTRLGEVRRIVEHANIPVVNYRDELTLLVPRDGGLRFAVVLQDAFDRIHTGDPSYQAAIERLIYESKALSGEAVAVEPALLADFQNQVKELYRLHKNVATDVSENGGKIVIHRQEVAMSKSQAEEVIANLQAARK